MWPSAFCSKGVLLIALATTGAVFAGDDPAAALDAAAKRVLPAGATIARRTEILTDAQREAVQQTAGVPLASRLVLHWTATAPTGGPALAHAYADTHVVRTKPETLLIVIDAAGVVQRVEVVLFTEPPEYQPSERWLAQFTGRALDPELALKRGIRALSGATLSSQAATDAVRRVLAIHQRLQQAPAL